MSQYQDVPHQETSEHVEVNDADNNIIDCNIDIEDMNVLENTKNNDRTVDNLDFEGKKLTRFQTR